MSPIGDLECAYEDCYSDKANTVKQCIMVFTLL